MRAFALGVLSLALFTTGCGSASEPQYREFDAAADAERPESTSVLPDPSGSTSTGAVPPELSSIDPRPEATSTDLPVRTTSPMPSPVGTALPVPASTTVVSVPPQATSTASPAGSSASPVPVGTSSSRAGMLPGDVVMEPREPKLLIPEKSFSKEGGALRVTFDDIDLLKVLNMEPVPEEAPTMFPDWLSGLDGKRVVIRGFMFPTLTQTGITYFQHVRDNEICCFGRTPKVYDRISTVLAKGETTDYIQGRPYDVIGTLRFDPIYEDGEWLQLYVLEDAKVVN